jgi:hypothetical protein
VPRTKTPTKLCTCASAISSKKVLDSLDPPSHTTPVFSSCATFPVCYFFDTFPVPGGMDPTSIKTNNRLCNKIDQHFVISLKTIENQFFFFWGE